MRKFGVEATILHVWCWSFNTISENIEEIASAGFDAIQVSPVQGCEIKRDCQRCKTEGRQRCVCFGDNWYFQYRPINFKIGNEYLGTRDEFIKMCEIADRFNVKVIVDVVANHVTSDMNLVSDDVRNLPNAFHDRGGLYDYNNRYQLTQGNLFALWDLCTENHAVQDMISGFLKDCLKCGAWGFRYDSAKHIELPKEVDGEFGSDFWPNVLSQAEKDGAGYQYGEVLQDGYGHEAISRFYEYARYMGVTATAYGVKIRQAIRDRNLDSNNIISYECDENALSPDRLVTWVESHDNYANGLNEWGSSAWMTDDQIKVGWAIVAGRAAGMPLFLSRPVGGGGTEADNRFPEKTKIGDKGSDLFRAPEVTAVNRFRKAMRGEGEYLRSQGREILMIERGNKGMVIVNLSNNKKIDSVTNLCDGTYIDDISGKEFYVQGGNLQGEVENKIAVLVNKAGHWIVH